MTLYTYSFINKKRDLSDIMSTVIKDEPRFISNFNCRETATAQKHEWFEDQLAGRSVTATGASGNTINASAADLAKLKVGTLLVVQNDSALFQVTAVNEDSFNVSKVAANGSVTENVNAQDVLNIVSSPMAEGSNSGDGEEAYHQSATEFNCTQIFRKDIIITGSAIAIDVYGGIDNQINRQTAFALGELACDLNRVALFGRRVEAAENVRGEAGGLYFFATREGSMQINANSKKFDSIMVNDALFLIKFACLATMSDIPAAAASMALIGRCALTFHIASSKYAAEHGSAAIYFGRIPWLGICLSIIIAASAGWMVYGAGIAVWLTGVAVLLPLL